MGMSSVMRMRRLGRTGLQVSALSLGTVELGMAYGLNGVKPSEKDAARVLERALELGINLLDTARAYGDSEEIIGRVLGSRRDAFVLCTKVLPGADVRASVHESLRHLRTDRVDILMLHSASLQLLREPVFAEDCAVLRDEGLIRFIGASVYDMEAALWAVRSGLYDCLQVAFSALDRRPETGLLREASMADVGIVCRSVLLKGVLSHRAELLPAALVDLRTAAGRLRALALRYGMTLPEMAYRYVFTADDTHSALIGTADVRELEEGVRFASQPPLPAELMAQIREVEVEERLLNPGNWGI